MYYQSYEEYMRDVLGYPNTYADSNLVPMYSPYDEYMEFPQRVNIARDYDELYPDIYKVVYPMVCKVCEKNKRAITKESLEEMVMEVYSHLEADENDFMGASVQVEVRKNGEEKKSDNKLENGEKSETRFNPSQNRLLKDLIAVLILRELLNRPSCPPRPPFPGARPPMPRSSYFMNMY